MLDGRDWRDAGLLRYTSQLDLLPLMPVID